VLRYFLLGAAIGAGTGIPIGPVNVAVIDTAYRHHRKRAIAVGLGGAAADLLYAFLGIVGVGPMLKENPAVPPILFALSGIVLVIYGMMTVRAKPADPTKASVDTEGARPYFWGGFALGAALILLNPAAILTWVVIVGSAFTNFTETQGMVAALGIGVGSFAWFSFVAFLADRGKRMLGDKTVWITRIVGFALVGYGLYSIGRAVHYWAT
jgi:putative LysE/RhtB family amino acid efflux pump